VFNISSGTTHKLYELAEIVGKYVPEADIRIGPGELDIPRSSHLDISKAKQELGYEPKVDFEDGVRETIMWLRRTVRSLT
jgi:nucleoside-diphosphate-sugar epimerase